jgi:hypothetical protein
MYQVQYRAAGAQWCSWMLPMPLQAATQAMAAIQTAKIGDEVRIAQPMNTPNVDIKV